MTARPAPSFGRRLARSFSRFGHLCVGIDPHGWLLEAWGLPDSAAGAREFGLRVIEAAAGRVGIVKPQVAFYERHGAAGFSALESVLAAARAAGLLVIADAKRGDIGSSAEAYGMAWLTPGSPLEADALTLSPYLGVGALDPVLALATRHAKGVYVLAATSNPDGAAVQTARTPAGEGGTRSVAGGIVTEVIERNAAHSPDASTGTERAIGDLGVVLGATVELSRYGIDTGSLAGPPATSVLAPGFGHQGGDLGRLRTSYGAAAPYTVVSQSRSLLTAGPATLAEAISEQADRVAACLA